MPSPVSEENAETVSAHRQKGSIVRRHRLSASVSVLGLFVFSCTVYYGRVVGVRLRFLGQQTRRAPQLALYNTSFVLVFECDKGGSALLVHDDLPRGSVVGRSWVKTSGRYCSIYARALRPLSHGNANTSYVGCGDHARRRERPAALLCTFLQSFYYLLYSTTVVFGSPLVRFILTCAAPR